MNYNNYCYNITALRCVVFEYFKRFTRTRCRRVIKTDGEDDDKTVIGTRPCNVNTLLTRYHRRRSDEHDENIIVTYNYCYRTSSRLCASSLSKTYATERRWRTRCRACRVDLTCVDPGPCVCGGGQSRDVVDCVRVYDIIIGGAIFFRLLLSGRRKVWQNIFLFTHAHARSYGIAHETWE